MNAEKSFQARVWLLWSLAAVGGGGLGLMLPTAEPLQPFTPIPIATLTGVFQAVIMGSFHLARRPWLWVVITGAGGCVNFWMAVLLIDRIILSVFLSGALLGVLQSLLLKASPRRRLRWTSTSVVWVIVTALSYGLAGAWIIHHQGIAGFDPSLGVGLAATLLAGGLQGSVLAALAKDS